MASRDYTISTSFPSGVDTLDLFDTTLATSFTVTPLSVDTLDDVLTVHFDGPLSAGDITTLDALVAAYVYDAPTTVALTTVAIVKKTILDTEYRLIGSTYYAGSNTSAPIAGLYINFTKSPDITAVDVLLVNGVTGEVLIEETVADGGLHKLTTVANVPKKSSTLEAYIKHNGEFLTLVSVELATAF